MDCGVDLSLYEPLHPPTSHYSSSLAPLLLTCFSPALPSPLTCPSRIHLSPPPFPAPNFHSSSAARSPAHPFILHCSHVHLPYSTSSASTDPLLFTHKVLPTTFLTPSSNLIFTFSLFLPCLLLSHHWRLESLQSHSLPILLDTSVEIFFY